MPQRLGGGPECAAGRGDYYLEHGGYTWRTLDGAHPQDSSNSAPNNGCQQECTAYYTQSWRSGSCRTYEPNYLPLPAGWVLAPNDATSVAVVAAHGWGTYALVLADGGVVGGANANSYDVGDQYRTGGLATSGGTYTVTTCNNRVLARCG
eukprot:COSAG04_NODE_264_length_18606_cov_9.965256_23_plen_150_part_00